MKGRLFPDGQFDKNEYRLIQEEKKQKRINDQEIRRKLANAEAEQIKESIAKAKTEKESSEQPKRYTVNRTKVINKRPMNNCLRLSCMIKA